MSPIFMVGAGIVLLGLGLGLGYCFAYIQGKRDASKADNIQKEFDDYRHEVGDHFNETAQHFQTLGLQYQALYQHMAQGAGSLCDQSQADAMLRLAAGSALVAAEDPTEEVESAPEIVRDYAPVNQLETVEDEVEVEAAEPAEESVVEEVAAEQVVAADPNEAERTVH